MLSYSERLQTRNLSRSILHTSNWLLQKQHTLFEQSLHEPRFDTDPLEARRTTVDSATNQIASVPGSAKVSCRFPQLQRLLALQIGDRFFSSSSSSRVSVYSCRRMCAISYFELLMMQAVWSIRILNGLYESPMMTPQVKQRARGVGIETKDFGEATDIDLHTL